MTSSTAFSNLLSQQDWLCLSFLTGIGPSRLSRLFTYLNQLDNHEEDLITGLSTQSANITYELLRQLKWPETTAHEAMEYLERGTLSTEQEQKKQTSLEWLEHEHHHIVLQNEVAYPAALKEISVAPAFLYVEGDLSCFAYPMLGIVGARHCSDYGRDMTLQLASQLSRRGIVVVSGGARGIDTAAHQGALEAQVTPTIAVMGTGLLHQYPKQNVPLFKDILQQGGCLVSEYPLMTSVRPHLFPPRNRIISGMSLGVLVTQASPKSGSLISANYAVQQNREVFALPGRVQDPQSEGCHQLIRQGAVLVRHLDDIMQELPSFESELSAAQEPPAKSKTANVSRETSQKESNKKRSTSPTAEQAKPKQQKMQRNKLPSNLSEHACAIAEILESENQPLDFDCLIRQTQLNATLMMQGLMELELNLCIENKGGMYRRC